MDSDARELAATFDLEKLTPAFYADPYPTYRALRETELCDEIVQGLWLPAVGEGGFDAVAGELLGDGCADLPGADDADASHGKGLSV